MTSNRLGLSYQVYPEGNVSRQGLYGSYLRSCTKFGVKAIKSVHFFFIPKIFILKYRLAALLASERPCGKSIPTSRSVRLPHAHASADPFPVSQTRRLGVRGASRYHYCGIIASNSAEAAILSQLAKEESDNSNNAADETSPGEASSIEPPPETESEAEPSSQ